MIRSFKSKETEKIFSRQKSASIPDEIQRLALRELRTLDQTPLPKEEWGRAITTAELTAARHQATARGIRFNCTNNGASASNGARATPTTSISSKAIARCEAHA